MIYENVEGLAEWNIDPAHWHGRAPGLSAMMRVKDEADWLRQSVVSIVPWCDEILIALQGDQTDGTGWVAAKLQAEHATKVRVVRYPFDSVPNGPGHDDQPRGSVHERAFFYNWCLARTCRTHVVKWDGDMVALDHLGQQVQAALASMDWVRFGGVEIVTVDPMRVSAVHPRANPEVRIFPARPSAHFVTGPACEVLADRGMPQTLPSPGYLHLKWTKPWRSIANAWPADWERHEHFRRLAARAEPGARYAGPMPACLAC